MSQAAKCFSFVAQALETESLTGSPKDRVVIATKQLVQAANLNADQLLAALAPETQEAVRQAFG
jgi:importin-5